MKPETNNLLFHGAEVTRAERVVNWSSPQRSGLNEKEIRLFTFENIPKRDPRLGRCLKVTLFS